MSTAMHNPSVASPQPRRRQLDVLPHWPLTTVAVLTTVDDGP